MRLILIPTALATAGLIASTAIAQQSPQKRFTIALTGEAEVAAGDPDGSGTAFIRINSRAGTLCYTLRVRGIEPATAAHIHEAPEGVAGPVVLELDAPTNGSSSGCERIGRDAALEILAAPEDYYVNVHNDPYPGGALRGQMG